MSRRVCVLLLDSLGIGASLDAPEYGDAGANTLGNICATCARGDADLLSKRQGPLSIPHLAELGLYHALLASSGIAYAPEALSPPRGSFGYAVEKSKGKDTPSGHWELMGVPVSFAWGYFPTTIPCFPAVLLESLQQKTGLSGFLGLCHSSGTKIIEELGQEHIKTGKPILYTSQDSVLQIAAHEKTFGLQRLYEVCEKAQELVQDAHIGRVIARPFLGEAGAFYRTENRKDYTQLPPAPTLLDIAKDAGREVIAIGKTADIFAHQGVTEVKKAKDNQSLFTKTLESLAKAPAGSIIFTNFVDFDSEYGHRRDVAGYAAALEAFDRQLPILMAELQPGDRVVITADHGCDPTFSGSDHTREHVPVLFFGQATPTKFIGRRETFADVGQTMAAYLQLPPLMHGVSFL